MNVKITKTEPRWDYKTGTCEDCRVTLIGNDLTKTEVKSLIRFAFAGLTSKSIPFFDVSELTMTNIVNEVESTGSWHTDDDAFVVEIIQ